MKQPKHWYAFRWACELHGHRDSNMCQPEECHYCKRGVNKYGDHFSCKPNVCPKLKDLKVYERANTGFMLKD